MSGQIATTQWSQVLAARDGSDTEAHQALEILCQTYWQPLYSYIRHQGAGPDEALFGEPSGFGGRSDVFLQSTWSWNLNGIYQFAPDRPYGFNVAANLYGREGYPLPYYWAYNGGDGLGRQNVSLLDGDLDRFRADDIFTADLRLEKEFATTANLGFTFSIDIFNIFNSALVMQRERRADTSLYNWLDQTLAPRVWRLGVRINWR